MTGGLQFSILGRRVGCGEIQFAFNLACDSLG